MILTYYVRNSKGTSFIQILYHRGKPHINSYQFTYKNGNSVNTFQVAQKNRSLPKLIIFIISQKNNFIHSQNTFFLDLNKNANSYNMCIVNFFSLNNLPVPQLIRTYRDRGIC